MTPIEELYARRTVRIATFARLAFSAATVAGALTAVAGWRPGVVIMLAGFVGTLAAHLLVGISGYRRAMRRPWPDVRPLVDEDEW